LALRGYKRPAYLLVSSVHRSAALQAVLKKAMKRAIDLAVVISSLMVLWPLLLAIAVCVKLTSAGPVLFRQQRVGWRGQLFEIFKFRTMVENAHQQGPQLTVLHDPRITPLGRLLRRTKLDELPQLLNVLRGDMSLVGPRPQIPSVVRHYPDDIHNIVFSVRPGITDPATIAYRDEERILAAADNPQVCHIDRILPHKLTMYVQYVRCRNTASDLRILLQTIGCLMPTAQDAAPTAKARLTASPERHSRGGLRAGNRRVAAAVRV